jgi:hypothetical protein
VRRLARLLALPAALLAGCLSPTPFQPADSDGSDGWTVSRTAQDHFHIRFAGNATTPARRVEEMLVYLAAQVTLRNGADYFEIAGDKLSRATTYDPLGEPYDAVLQCCHWRGVVSHEYEAEADIVIHQGKPPKEDPALHDAHAVVEELAPRIPRGRHGTY